MVLKITSKSSWAGYIASGSNIASVSGTITVPTHSYVGYWPNVDYILYWVGIGGFSSNSKGLWQAGVQEQVNSDNSDSIDVWYEETTKSGGPVVYHNFTGGIDQGAQIIVDLSVSSGISYFSVGYWNYVNLVWWNGSVSFTPDQTTAEWVEEAWGGGQYMIPDVGTVPFSDPSYCQSGCGTPVYSYVLPITAIDSKDADSWVNLMGFYQYVTPSTISGNDEFKLAYSQGS